MSHITKITFYQLHLCDNLTILRQGFLHAIKGKLLKKREKNICVQKCYQHISSSEETWV